MSQKKPGKEVIKEALETMPTTSGVYRMIDEKGKVLYVGKAKNLAKRVAAYTDIHKNSPRINLMVSKTSSLEIITTKTEAEAFLLEANLIKNFKPRYNIALKDDKSFPYILIRENHNFPQITKHRGTRKEKGNYFGPFASATDVNQTITTLQKIFLLRSCSDHYFATRKRPCILYQIKRCSAPCTGKIDENGYKALVKETEAFLSGNSEKVKQALIAQMEEQSNKMQFEQAAQIRDRIKSLNSILAKQSINFIGLGDVDIIGIFRQEDKIAVQVFFIRAGHNYGNKSYFPQNTEDMQDSEIMSSFIAKFYQTNIPPQEIISNINLEDRLVIEQILSNTAGYQVVIKTNVRGARADILENCVSNAREALKRKLQESSKGVQNFKDLVRLFELQRDPGRIEIYDNSHIMGKNAIGAMVVATKEGFDKSSYRKYNIDMGTVRGGDDYQMMRYVLTRRFKRLLQNGCSKGDEGFPDLILIDGGKGHLNAVKAILEQYPFKEDIMLVAISKGPDRNAGKEVFHTLDRTPFTLPKDLEVMKYLQILRDEAHRFAITGHRNRRKKTLTSSVLDKIKGIGPKRKKLLLNHFGSVEEILKASVEDIAKLDNINKKTANTIFEQLHNQ